MKNRKTHRKILKDSDRKESGECFVLCAYLKIHRKGIAAAVFFGVIAAVIFALYQLPVSAVAYVTALWAFFGMIVLGLDYGQFCLKHRELQRRLNILREGLDESPGSGEQQSVRAFDPDVILEHLPTPSGLLEGDYQELLNLLCRERRELREEMEQRYREMIDYYTVWAHQIKTPIAAMRLMLQEERSPGNRDRNETVGSVDFGKGSAGAAGVEEEAEKTEANIRALREELRRIEQYVEMVLCYLRLDSKSTDYVIREYDLDEIVKQAVRRHATTFIQKRLRLEYEPLGARVVTDEKWLLFVIEQVLSNALKYTSEGGITITLEAPKTLCIRDTGIGIAPEDLPRVFEKGYTGDNGRSDKKASGIGMYLCSRICANLGHGITVDSMPGQGTEVRLDLKNAELEIE